MMKRPIHISLKALFYMLVLVCTDSRFSEAATPNSLLTDKSRTNNGIALLDEVKVAATGLSGVSYSWLMTHLGKPDSKPASKWSHFVEGETDGKVTHVKMTAGPVLIEMAHTPKKVGFHVDGRWEFADLNAPEMAGARVWTYRPAADIALHIAAGANSVTNADGIIVATLGPEVATELLAGYFLYEDARRSAKDIKGWAKFWIDKGALTKFAFHVSGVLSNPAKNEVVPSVDDTTIEIKAVGKTTVHVPESVKARIL